MLDSVVAALTGYPSWGAAFALRPLCVARDLGWCGHDYFRWGGHISNRKHSQILRARRAGFYHRAGVSSVYSALALRTEWGSVQSALPLLGGREAHILCGEIPHLG